MEVQVHSEQRILLNCHNLTSKEHIWIPDRHDFQYSLQNYTEY